MKHFIILLFFLVPAISSKAQVYKTFLDEKGNLVDQSKAKSYLMVRQLADSVWLMNQFDMRDAIMVSGTFKDRTLRVPNGKFVYYDTFNPPEGLNLKDKYIIDTQNYIKTYGVYKNGLKDGYWIDYFGGKYKAVVSYYENGILNGPYESYNQETHTVMVQGNYVHGVRDGEWHILNTHGEIIETDLYRDGKIYQRHKSITNYNAPEPTKEFYKFMDKGIRKIINDRDIATIYVSVTITAQGKLVDPQIVMGKGYTASFDKQLLNIFSSSPLWNPANKGDANKPIEDFSSISIQIRNGQVQITIINYGKDVFYNLTH